MKFMLRAGLLAMAFWASAAVRAADPPDPAVACKDLDRRISEALREVINIGANIFNAGNEQGCYRLYEGALTTSIPLLDHRAALKRSVEERLAKARKLPFAADQAFALREAIDEIRATLRPDATVTAAPRRGTLWERLGGEPAVRAVVKEFVKVAAADPKVNYTRGNKHPLDAAAVAGLEQRIVELVSAVTGGPLDYKGKDMRTAHKGMAITEAEFDAAAADLSAVLKKFNVPQKESDDLLAVIASTRREIVETEKTAPAKLKSLWERLGGEPAVKLVIHDFVAAAAANPKVNFLRNGQFKPDDKGLAALERKLLEFVSSATGGPLTYTGRDMKTIHKGMNITEAEFNALADDLVSALKKYAVPQKEIDELIGIIATTKKDIVEK